MIILEEDAGSSKAMGYKEPATTLEAQSEPAPPPYEAPYEGPSSYDSAPALPQDVVSDHGLEAPPNRRRALKRRRFIHFFLATVVLVAAFVLIRSFSGGRVCGF
jgi:hypothetical protein